MYFLNLYLYQISISYPTPTLSILLYIKKKKKKQVADRTKQPLLPEGNRGCFLVIISGMSRHPAPLPFQGLQLEITVPFSSSGTAEHPGRRQRLRSEQPG